MSLFASIAAIVVPLADFHRKSFRWRQQLRWGLLVSWVSSRNKNLTQFSTMNNKPKLKKSVNVCQMYSGIHAMMNFCFEWISIVIKGKTVFSWFYLLCIPAKKKLLSCCQATSLKCQFLHFQSVDRSLKNKEGNLFPFVIINTKF